MSRVNRGPGDAAMFRLCSVIHREEWHGKERELVGLPMEAWRRLAARSIHHGVAGLASRNLDWACEEAGLSIDIADELRARRRQVLAQNLARKAAARRVIESFQREGIPYLVLKGLALAEEAYGDLSLRGFNDFDVMVPREAVGGAFQVALDLGYALKTLGHVDEHLECGAHAVDMAHRDGTSLDLHWAIAAELPEATTQIAWQSGVPAPAGSDLGGLRLSTEMSLVHLAAHFHAHQYKVLRPLVDLYFVARTSKAIDPARLWNLAGTLKHAEVLEIAVVLAERCFGAGSLAPIVRRPEPGLHARWASRIVTDALLLDAPERPRIDNWMRYLLAAGGLRFTLHGLVQTLLPGKLEIAKYFQAPFRAGLYPRYYWRQFVKALTLSSKYR